MQTTETHPAETPAQAPKLDLRSLLERLKIPEIDAKTLIEGRRKDIEALLTANEKAFAAFEALTRKQAELLSEVMKEWQAGARDFVAHTGAADKVNQTAAHAQKVFTQALAAMKEMAEIASKSTQEVVTILNQRYHAGLEEIRTSLHLKH